MRLHARIDLREGADRAGNRAGRDLFARCHEARLGAIEFGIGLRELQPEGHGLGMDAVRAADGRRQLVLEGPLLERGQQLVGIGDQDVGRARELDRKAGIEHVRRRHALMHEARLGADDLGQMGQEGDDVVLDLGLDGVDAGDVEHRGFALVADGFGGILGDQAQFGHGIGRMRFDLEPDAEFGFRRPDGGHFRPGIARDHGALVSRIGAPG